MPTVAVPDPATALNFGPTRKQRLVRALACGLLVGVVFGALETWHVIARHGVFSLPIGAAAALVGAALCASFVWVLTQPIVVGRREIWEPASGAIAYHEIAGDPALEPGRMMTRLRLETREGTPRWRGARVRRIDVSHLSAPMREQLMAALRVALAAQRRMQPNEWDEFLRAFRASGGAAADR